MATKSASVRVPSQQPRVLRLSNEKNGDVGLWALHIAPGIYLTVEKDFN